MVAHSFDPLRRLTYDDFRRLAQDEGLSPAQRIGFPDEYRAGLLEGIWSDIYSKLELGQRTRPVLLDLGPGCGELGLRVTEWGLSQTGHLLLMDAPEVLSRLPDGCQITKYEGRFPEAAAPLMNQWQGKVDHLLCYSVFHYVFAEGNPFTFLDHALLLLARGGRMLIGDIPNASRLKRFLDSPEGGVYHRHYTGIEEDPVIRAHQPGDGHIDDGVLAALVQRCHAAGFHAHLVPQPSFLPMSNRREDLLVIRP